MIRITTATQAKGYIGQMLYWEDRGQRYVFQRCGILTSTFRGRLEFDDSQDYRLISEYTKLSTEPTVEQGM